MKNKTNILIGIILVAVLATINYLPLDNTQTLTAEDLALNEQEATVRSIESVQPAVVSIRVFVFDFGLPSLARP